MSEYKFNKINVSNISFSDLKISQTANGATRKQVFINYNNGKFLIETPELYFPFGLYEDQATDSNGKITGSKYSLTTSLGKSDNDNNVKFNELLTSIDKMVIKTCVENSLSWIKKKNITNKEVEFFYNKMVKKYKDKETGEESGKYPDSFKVKLNNYDNQFDCKVYDKSNVQNKLSDEDIKKNLSKGSRGKLLIQCNGIYFASGKFGVTWKLVQAKITPSKNMKEYAFLSSDSDEE